MGEPHPDAGKAAEPGPDDEYDTRDTEALIDLAVYDPQPQEVTDPADPSYVLPFPVPDAPVLLRPEEQYPGGEAA